MQKNVPFSKKVLSLGWGYIDETYNPGIITKLIEKTIKNKGYEILQYNDSFGLPELRKLGISFLENNFGIKNINFEEIMITNGATAGIDLASRFILEQGKYNSIVFEPIYDTALKSLKRNSRKVYSLELNLFDEKNIIDFEKLENLMQNDKTKLIYINSNFQNPTGIVFSQKIKEKIYTLAKKYNIIILEDDPYKIYNFEKLDLGENIINLDKEKNNIIYLNSISKVFFPGLRIGFLVGNKKIIKGISELQKYSTSSANLIMQGATIEALKNGEIEKSTKYYQTSIKQKRNKIIELLDKNGFFSKNSPILFSNSKGGFYLWGKFKDGRDINKFLEKSLKYGISFVPGNIYGLDGKYNNSFRLAYAQIDINKIEEAIKRFTKVVKDFNF